MAVLAPPYDACNTEAATELAGAILAGLAYWK